MRKLVIILPVLVLISLLGSSANANSSDKCTYSRLENIAAVDCSMEQLIPLAQTADDGGALGEKAKVQAMRDALYSPVPEMKISGNTAQVQANWQTAGNFLTAIREDEV